MQEDDDAGQVNTLLPLPAESVPSSAAFRALPVGTAAAMIKKTPLQVLDLDVWATKPAWCQPWSIVGTGAAIVGGVWAVSGHSAGWTAAAAVPIAAWWYLFLGLMPAGYREYAAEMNARQAALRAQLEQQRRLQQRQQDQRGQP